MRHELRPDSTQQDVREGFGQDAGLFGGQHFDCGHHIGFIEANIAFALADPQFSAQMIRVLEKFGPEARKSAA